MNRLEYLKQKNKKNNLYKKLINIYEIPLINNISIKSDFFYRDCAFCNINKLYNQDRCLNILDDDYKNNLKKAMKDIKEKILLNLKFLDEQLLIAFESLYSIYFFSININDLLNKYNSIIKYMIDYYESNNRFHDILILNKSCTKIINAFQVEQEMFICIYNFFL